MKEQLKAQDTQLMKERQLEAQDIKLMKERLKAQNTQLMKELRLEAQDTQLMMEPLSSDWNENSVFSTCDDASELENLVQDGILFDIFDIRNNTITIIDPNAAWQPCPQPSEKRRKKKTPSQPDLKWMDMFEALLDFIEEEKWRFREENPSEQWSWDGNVPTRYRTARGKALGRHAARPC